MPRRFRIEVEKDYFNFASAHFLIFANGGREALHGHNYQVSVAVEGEMDSAGVILDYIKLKPLIKRVCDDLDHRTLIQNKSPHLTIRSKDNAVYVLYKREKLLLPRQDVILLPIVNTSTELLAEYISRKIQRIIHRYFPRARVRAIEVGVEESRGQRGFFHGEF